MIDDGMAVGGGKLVAQGVVCRNNGKDRNEQAAACVGDPLDWVVSKAADSMAPDGRCR